MISIIAPVHNEKENLTEFNDRVLSVMQTIGEKYEVIYKFMTFYTISVAL